jgi:hypothetical protein
MKIAHMSRRAKAVTLLATAVTSLSAVAFTGPASAAPNTTKSFKVTYNINCTVSFFGSSTQSITLSGRVPISVVHGTKFHITAIKIVEHVPAALGMAAYAAGIRSFDGTIISSNEGVSNGSPNPVNVLGSTGYLLPTGANREQIQNGPFNILIPVTLTLKSPAVTAGTAGTNLVTTAGSGAANLNFYDANGNLIAANQPVTCSTPSPTVTLTSIPVT